MTMLQMWILAGVLVAGGVTCLVWYLLPAQPDLSDVMTRLSPGLTRTVAADSSTKASELGLSSRVGRWGMRHLPSRLLSSAPTRDLALLGKPVNVFYGDKLLHVAAVLVAVPLISAVWSVVIQMPVYVPTAVTLIAAAVVWFVPNLNVKEEAAKAREEFSRALACYIDLVALERKAGGAATSQALDNAAHLGDSWPFRRIREALARSGFAGSQPADALHDLAIELGLSDLDDLADVMRLSGGEGVQVYDTLRARSGAMRQARLTADLSHANALGERMTIPTTLMALSIALIILVAVGINLITA